MSEATLRKIHAETEAEILSLKSESDAWDLLLRFYVKMGKDVAENAYLTGSGLGGDDLSEVYEANLRRLLENILASQAEYGLSDDRHTQAALKWVGDAFEARFTELAAMNVRGYA